MRRLVPFLLVSAGLHGLIFLVGLFEPSHHLDMLFEARLSKSPQRANSRDAEATRDDGTVPSNSSRGGATASNDQKSDIVKKEHAKIQQKLALGYPERARRLGQQGAVEVSFTVVNGRATQVTYLQRTGYDDLDQLIGVTLRSWQFSSQLTGNVKLRFVFQLSQ